MGSKRARAPSRPRAAITIAAVALAAWCGRGAPASDEAGRAAAPRKPSPEAAAPAAWVGPRVFDVPLYPRAAEATALVDWMRAAWMAEGEPAALFPARFGERVFATTDDFDEVRAFYRPFARHVLMDHAIEMGHAVEPGAHHQNQHLFTAITSAPDGTLVKLTVSRPFFRYPDRQRIDRTVIQIGRVGTRP
ncbi:MAG TPA: hypothetical protein VML54_00180 [Candidatus Limnocylindrales bacterium]|nr:hypothetical protein [Candidatus Limnocylindrales bacterium]